jgi:hypothetical protein
MYWHRELYRKWTSSVAQRINYTDKGREINNTRKLQNGKPHCTTPRLYYDQVEKSVVKDGGNLLITTGEQKKKNAA